MSSPLRPTKKLTGSPLRKQGKTVQRASTDPGIQCEKITVPLRKRQTVASCQSPATGSISTSQLALRRRRQKGHRQSFFLRNLQIPGRRNASSGNKGRLGKHKKPSNAFDKVLSGLNAILVSEEEAELVNPRTSTKYLESPKSPASPTRGRRQSTVILHHLIGVESKAKKKNIGNYYSQSHYSKN